MAHNSRVRGSSDTWANITRAELAALDLGVRSGINGVDGGCWVPSSPIGISNLLVGAPTLVCRGGSITTGTSTGTIILGDNDFPLYDAVGNVPHTKRTILYPFSAAGVDVPQLWTCRRENGAIQAVAPAYDLNDGVGVRRATAWTRLRGHDSAILKEVRVTFRVAFPHATLPASMPGARVYAVDAFGDYFFLTSAAAGADASGRIYAAKPASPDAWFNGGAPQTITIPCDQFNGSNVGSYDVILEVIDEQGASGWNWELSQLAPVRLMADSYIDLTGGANTIDGFTIVDGDRILATAQASPTTNGVWIAKIGAQWKRAPDFTQQTFRQGLLIPVQSGVKYGGLLVQCKPTIETWNPGTPSPGSPATIQWSPGQAAFLGGVGITPSSTGRQTGLWYYPAAGSTGNTSSPEPSWPTVIGATVQDHTGTITWVAMGFDADPLTFVVRPDESYPAITDGLLSYGTMWHGAQADFVGISDMRWQ